MIKLGKSAVFAALAIIAIMASGTIVEARIGPPGSQYDRDAMIEEAYFSVTGVVGSHPFPTSSLLGQWNYMTYDIPAQNIIIGRLGSGNAGWTTPVTYDVNPNGYVPNGYLDNKGRGGQCLFFVNLLLYRSEADRRVASGANCNYCWANIETHSIAIDSARPKRGDIVFKPRPGQHIAVVVYRNGNDVWLVDSNFATGGNNEVAALRYTTINWLTGNGYKVYTDVSYYNN